jgi:hypothetical protein
MVWEAERIKIAAAFTSSRKILNGKTRGVKLDRNIVIVS